MHLSTKAFYVGGYFGFTNKVKNMCPILNFCNINNS